MLMRTCSRIVLLAITAVGAVGNVTCDYCISVGGSWNSLASVCNSTEGGCIDDAFGCCSSLDCCDIIDGCREPGQDTCLRCKEDIDGNCVERYWAGYGAGPDIRPWYNGISFICDESQPSPPTCAQCSVRNEQEIRNLPRFRDRLWDECSKEICGTLTRQVDPCYNPRSCACFCKRANDLGARCPHLSNLPWK